MDDQQINSSYFGIKQVISESQKGGDSTQNSTPYGDSRNLQDLNVMRDEKSLGSFVNSSRPMSVSNNNISINNKKFEEKYIIERQENEKMMKVIAELKKKNESLTKALNVFVFEETKTPKQKNIKQSVFK